MKRTDIEAIRETNLLFAEIAGTLDTFLGQPLLSLRNRQIAYSDAALNVNESSARPLVSTAFVSAFAGVLLLAEVYKVADPALAHFVVRNSYQRGSRRVPAACRSCRQRTPQH